VRFLFNVTPHAGHLHASVGLAQHLVRMGHEVRFFCYADPDRVSARLRRAGLNGPCMGPAAAAVRPLSHRPIPREELTRMFEDPTRRRRFVEQMYLANPRRRLEALRAAIRDVRPDILCNDAICDDGAVAAQLESVRWASVASSWRMTQPGDYESVAHEVESLEGARKAWAQSFGVELVVCGGECVSPWLNLVFSVEELTPRHGNFPPNTHLVGPMRPVPRGDDVDFPWDRLGPERPLMYVSSGSLFGFSATAVSTIIEAGLARGAQIVVSGDRAETDADRDDVIRVRVAPQVALLERATLFVTHGGANSVMEGLVAGAPLLVIPLAWDQPLSAFFVGRAGVGRALAHTPWDPHACRDNIAAMLSNEAAERTQARRFKRLLAERDGSRDGAMLLTSA